MEEVQLKLRIKDKLAILALILGPTCGPCGYLQASSRVGRYLVGIMPSKAMKREIVATNESMVISIFVVIQEVTSIGE